MYKVTTGGLGYYVRGLGDLPGFPGADPQGLLTNIGESIWSVLGNLLYIMGTVPTDMLDQGPAGRQAVEKYFASLVSTADVANGNFSKINAAGNQTALHFLKMAGGQPRGATGVAPGDLMGSCLAYSVGPSQFYASQAHFSGSWSPQTKCNQLKALMGGSGLNWLQVAAGGDGLGNMPAGSGMSQAEIDRANAAAAAGPGTPQFWDPQTGKLIGGSGPSPVNQYPVATQVNSDPVAAPVVQVYQPAQPVQQAYYQPAAAPQMALPPTVSNPLTGAAQSTSSGPLAMVAPVGSTPQTSQGQRRNRQQQTQQYPASVSQSAAVVPPATAATAASSSTLGGITDWITANPLIAAGIAAAGLYMFSKGGRR